MSSFDKALGRHWLSRLLTSLFVLSLATSCYDHHRCGDGEFCDYGDNDCDGEVDEDFLDENGVYFTDEHCGACGVSCAAVFPTAAETACVVDALGVAACKILECTPGFHLAGDGACVPDVPVQCFPCTSDTDCQLRNPLAQCVESLNGGRCAEPCGFVGCPPGTECVSEGEDLPPLCIPIGGDCACNVETLGLVVACFVDRGDGHQCAGVEICGGDGFGACEPALSEVCNGQDEDCDGQVDEDFRDEVGRYVHRLHCGGCAQPCVEPGPNMVAECLPRGAGVRCQVECADGFVDVDGIPANGCECERWDGTGPPPVVGGDADCDGLADDTDDFIYVTATGSDSNPGTLVQPMRSIQAALGRGRSAGKDVLVARGVYDGPFDLVAGVDIFGGYRPDFRDRDLELYPVLVERRGSDPGAPVLTCRGISQLTRVEGFVISGTDASQPGAGATAVYIDGCTAQVKLRAITVLAGRGADGVRGDDSSDNLSDLGLDGLDQLNGADGQNGLDVSIGSECSVVSGGGGGGKSCGGLIISGGNGGDGACPESGCTNGSACGNAGCTDFTVGGICDFAAVLRAAVPNPAAVPGRGTAGGTAGELTYNAPTNRGLCNFCDDNPTLPRIGGIGGDGASGSDGGGGVGCAASPVLDAASGRLSGGAGTNGTGGANGSGGGGGTAGAGYDVIGGTSGVCSDRAGGAGGGGGSGGCGSPASDGGQGGGTAAGIVIRLGATANEGPEFTDVRVVTASGGHGGDGGIGANGGAPGVGGLGGTARFWCARNGGRGGDGGRGGAGGGGGGGCGGGSHGVVITGGRDGSAYRDHLAATLTTEATGVPGRGGLGGFSPRTPGTPGAIGDDTLVLLL